MIKFLSNFRMIPWIKLFIGLTTFGLAAACASTTNVGMPCANPQVQTLRSQELQKIAQADQDDRIWQVRGVQPSPAILQEMGERDLLRRKRVGEIFGEACLASAEDYKAAYLVFQHGNSPGHYFQAFLWSQEAFKRGASNMKAEIAQAADRYLVSIGHKQIFGTQAFQAEIGACWCLQPIEEQFPASRLVEYRGGASAAYTGTNFLKILNAGKTCLHTFCETKLLPSPQGSLPGFW